MATGLLDSYPVTMAKGVRNLALGRVLLKKNAAIAAEEIVVGVEFSAPWQKCEITGSMFFFGQTNDVTIVQPSAADVVGGVEHEEDVTISGLTVNALNVPISAGLANAYTTARGAYLRLRTLPSYVSTLKLVEEDFTVEGIPAPAEHRFPAIYVVEEVGRLAPYSNMSWIQSTNILVRYYEAMNSSYDRQTFKDTVRGIAQNLMQDPTLGGTAYDSVCETFTMSSGGRIGNREVQTKLSNKIDWADIGIIGKRVIPFDKVTGV